jgi:hypothetical protein
MKYTNTVQAAFLDLDARYFGGRLVAGGWNAQAALTFPQLLEAIRRKYEGETRRDRISGVRDMHYNFQKTGRDVHGYYYRDEIRYVQLQTGSVKVADVGFCVENGKKTILVNPRFPSLTVSTLLHEGCHALVEDMGKGNEQHPGNSHTMNLTNHGLTWKGEMEAMIALLPEGLAAEMTADLERYYPEGWELIVEANRQLAEERRRVA